jgi:hypothetical protein
VIGYGKTTLVLTRTWNFSIAVGTPECWTRQNKTEQNWTELNWTELNWTELNWIEPNWIELNWTEYIRVSSPYRPNAGKPYYHQAHCAPMRSKLSSPGKNLIQVHQP